MNAVCTDDGDDDDCAGDVGGGGGAGGGNDSPSISFHHPRFDSVSITLRNKPVGQNILRIQYLNNGQTLRHSVAQEFKTFIYKQSVQNKQNWNYFSIINF